MPDDADPSEDADQARLKALFTAHYGHVLRFAGRRADDTETAQDVAAETFLVAWRRIDRVPRDVDDALPWLYGVARNVLANEQRGRRRGGRLAARLGRALPVTAADHAGEVVEGLNVRQALATLSARDQETLRLVGWECLDAASAARVVGCSARTFKVRLHRARRRLERVLERAEAESERRHGGQPEDPEAWRARAELNGGWA